MFYYILKLNVAYNKPRNYIKLSEPNSNITEKNQIITIELPRKGDTIL